jgi:DUF1009 family protein
MPGVAGDEPPLAIMCGGGAFPGAVADAVQRGGGKVLLFAFREFADPAIVERYPHEWMYLGQAGRLDRLLRQYGVRELTFVGVVHRPRLRDIRIDWLTLRMLPRYLAAQRRGDNHLLSFIAGAFEEHGIRVRGVHEVAPEILIPSGVLGAHRPSAQETGEIDLGRAVIRALGPLDVGQAAVVVGGRVVAIEAAEGTGAMLERVAVLRAEGRVRAAPPAGVLVKAPKPGQDRRLDLPAIGAETAKQAAAAGLAGIAVEAGGTIVADANALVQAADAAGLFVLGFEPG